MNKKEENYIQQKITGGVQKVMINEKETAETDELDPRFSEQKTGINNFGDQQEKEKGDES